MTKEPKWLNPTVWKHSRISRCFSALTGFPWKFIAEVCRFRPSNNTGWETKSVERANPFAPTLRKDLQSKEVRRPNSSDICGWQSVRATKCGFGQDIAWTWIISTKPCGSIGGTSTKKFRKCCTVCRASGASVEAGNFLSSDFCLLTSGSVAERSVSL